MSADIASALASRSIDEQISILLALFGAEGTEGLSADAQEALQSAKAWFDSLTPAEKEAFLGRFRATVEYEGSQTDGYVIVLSIREADGHTTLKRLSFVKKDGEFLLVKVEVKAS